MEDVWVKMAPRAAHANTKGIDMPSGKSFVVLLSKNLMERLDRLLISGATITL